MNPAINFHSHLAEQFPVKYRDNKDFIQRYNIWIRIIKEISQSHFQVLDLGCGSGILTTFLSSRCEQVTAIDGSEEMLEILKKDITSEGFKNIKIIQGDIPDTLYSLDSSSYDLVVASSLLEYLEDIELVLKEIMRLLKPNANLILSVPNSSSLFRKMEKMLYSTIKYPSYYEFVKFTTTTASFSTLLEKLGFSVTLIEGYGNSYPCAKFIKSLFGQDRCNNMLIFIASKRS